MQLLYFSVGFISTSSHISQSVSRPCEKRLYFNRSYFDEFRGRLQPESRPLENGGTEVSITEAIDPAPFRRRLQWWLDDEFRDRTNAMRAYLDGRPDWSMIARQFPKDAKGKRQTARAAEVFS